MTIRYAQNGRPLPVPIPVAEPYFNAALENRLLLPHCPHDGFFFYPRSHCPHCLGNDWTWREAPKGGHVYAFTIDRVGHEPGLKPFVPFALAVVDMAAGPRMTGMVTGIAVDAVSVGMAVEAYFLIVEGAPLLHFRPSAGSE